MCETSSINEFHFDAVQTTVYGGCDRAACLHTACVPSAIATVRDENLCCFR